MMPDYGCNHALPSYSIYLQHFTRAPWSTITSSSEKYYVYPWYPRWHKHGKWLRGRNTSQLAP